MNNLLGEHHTYSPKVEYYKEYKNLEKNVIQKFKVFEY